MSSKLKTSPTTANVFHITSDKEFNEIILKAASNNITVFAKFGAEWCGPCKRIQPHYEELANIHTNSIFLCIDVDKVKNLSAAYGVSSLPTFLVFKDAKYSLLTKGANLKLLKELVENQLSV